MKFQVYASGGEIQYFELYHDAVNYLESAIAQWNAYHGDGSTDLQMWISKVPDKGDTIQVSVGDETSVKGVMGG